MENLEISVEVKANANKPFEETKSGNTTCLEFGKPFALFVISIMYG